MANHIIEIAYVKLIPGTDPSEGDAQRIMQETLQTIVSQPGVKNLYWGRQIENPDTYQLVVGP